MKKIVQMDNKILRTKAQEVAKEDITSKKVKDIIKNMNQALQTQNDGVAIAAPQIGEAYRIFTVSPVLFEKPEEENLVFINPTIVKKSKESTWLDEGCLSCRWKVGQVKRHDAVHIHAYDEYGEEFLLFAEGLLAHIFQHETDHLDGILFVDKARNLRDMTQEEIAEVLNGSE